MSAAQSNNNAQPASTWTEPPWSGWIETTGDALLILEAARRGLIPRVTRRLVDAERKMITSGSVFVFDEDESGIKRWTDGFFWSPSRILGNFLLYRETDKRGASHRAGRPDPSLCDPNDAISHHLTDTGQLSRPKCDENHLGGADKQREKILMGSLTNSYKFKPDGLMKKTFSLTIGGVSQHLISYYKIEDVQNGRLRSPSSLPELASLDISPEYLDKTHFRNPPKVDVGVDGLPRYRGEADDIESSPPLLPAPLSTGPLPDGRIADPTGANRRGKRFDPYPPGTKRPRRPTKSGNGEPTTPTEPQQSLVPSPTVPPAASYAEPIVSIAPPPYPPSYGPVASYHQMPGYPAMSPQPHPAYPSPPPHVYYSPGGPPQQTPPQASYQYGYPPGSTVSTNDPQQHQHQQQQQQAVQDAGQQQQQQQVAYYPYAAQVHPVPYASSWPSYAYPAHTHAHPASAHQNRQSSIANAAPIDGDPLSGESDEG